LLQNVPIASFCANYGYSVVSILPTQNTMLKYVIEGKG